MQKILIYAKCKNPKATRAPNTLYIELPDDLIKKINDHLEYMIPNNVEEICMPLPKSAIWAYKEAYSRNAEVMDKSKSLSPEKLAEVIRNSTDQHAKVQLDYIVIEQNQDIHFRASLIEHGRYCIVETPSIEFHLLEEGNHIFMFPKTQFNKDIQE